MAIDAVQSLLCQDEDFQVVVVENFDLLQPQSLDYPYIERARQLFSSDDRVRWVRSAEVLAIQDNFNFAVSFADRQFIKVLGADDRVIMGGVLKLLNMIHREPSCKFHGHLATIIGSDGQVIRHQNSYTSTGAPLLTTGKAALKLKLRQIARFKEPACNLFSKEAWQAIGCYSTKLRFCFDIEFNVRMMSSFPSCLWSEYVTELRRHSHSDGATLSADLAVDDLAEVIESIKAILGCDFNPSDRVYAKSWIAYRVIELSLSRYRHNPLSLLRFLARNRSWLMVSPLSLADSLGMLTRRIFLGDVQRIISK